MKKIFLICLLTLSLGAQAQGMGMGMGKDSRGENPMSWVKTLDLTTEQKTKMAEIQKAMKEERTKMHEQMQKGRSGLLELMKSTASDEELKAQFEQMQKARLEEMSKHFERMLAIRKILTPAQRAKAAEYMEAHKPMMKMMGHPPMRE